MTITIRSTREGFYRCGIKHGLTAKDYPNDFFSPADFERLMADSTLVVTVTQGEGEAVLIDSAAALDPFKMPLAELKKLAKDMGLAYARTVKQAELAQMINDELARCHKQEMAKLDKAAAANQSGDESDPPIDDDPPAGDSTDDDDAGGTDGTEDNGEPVPE